MDVSADIQVEQNNVKRKTTRRALEGGDPELAANQRRAKGQLTLSEVGVKGLASKVIKRPELLKGTEKPNRLKGYVCERRQTEDDYNTRSLIVTEQAPKIANNSNEEVVVGLKEMQFWKDLEKEQSIATILQTYTRHKNQAALERMSRPTFLKYVEGRLVKVGAWPVNFQHQFQGGFAWGAYPLGPPRGVPG